MYNKPFVFRSIFFPSLFDMKMSAPFLFLSSFWESSYFRRINTIFEDDTIPFQFFYQLLIRKIEITSFLSII